MRQRSMRQKTTNMMKQTGFWKTLVKSILRKSCVRRLRPTPSFLKRKRTSPCCAARSIRPTACSAPPPTVSPPSIRWNPPAGASCAIAKSLGITACATAVPPCPPPNRSSRPFSPTHSKQPTLGSGPLAKMHARLPFQTKASAPMAQKAPHCWPRPSPPTAPHLRSAPAPIIRWTGP